MDCPCDGQEVIPPLSQCSMLSVVRCFSMGDALQVHSMSRMNSLSWESLWAVSCAGCHSQCYCPSHTAGRGEAIWDSPASSFNTQSFWSVLEMSGLAVMDAGWLRETLLGGRAQGGAGKPVPVVGSVGLSWVVLLKTSPLLFPTVFTALPEHPCQGQALPGIPWH